MLTRYKISIYGSEDHTHIEMLLTPTEYAVVRLLVEKVNNACTNAYKPEMEVSPS